MKEVRPRFPIEWKPVLRSIRKLGIDRVRDLIEALNEEEGVREPEYETSAKITGDGLYIAFGCMHYPFESRRFHDFLCEYIAKQKPAAVIAAGDLIDAFSVSSHNRGQWLIPGLTLQYEYESTNPRLTELDQAIGSARKIFIEGNHEYRIERTKNQVDLAKLGGAVRDYAEGLRLRERGYEVLRPWKESFVDLAGVEVIHGEYFNKVATKTHLEVVKRDCIHFHTHRYQSYSDGEITALSPGWGGDADAPVFRYRSRLQRKAWSHGFAVIEVEGGRAQFRAVRM